ncbi:phosphomethylpyrimidine synthase ThiC [Thermospira aquatica]|uniref:Phosphomethylpyrimidine synthase n=1 Tax=Thermospira aquatica TaxID=2828656 RepID=A0AAX3BFC9_9SPIR|nr:phosphomethylpyrimidine synthase ThiC [Thermospira aquatica]URA10926.1 phosphomethylpyrimidine synthase ThiC [Thermospira aquatica]
MTQLEYAKKNLITPEMVEIARVEELSPEEIKELVAKGEVVILKNTKRDTIPTAVGTKMRTKINANIGSSPEKMDLKWELDKLAVCEKYGADTVMDLSLGGILNEVRKKILASTRLPVGTVPIYQVGFELARNAKHLEEMTIDHFLSVLRQQGEEGVDFVTIHAGITQKTWQYIKEKKRILDVVSRGGSMLCAWMEKNQRENLLYEHFDAILEVAKEYDMTISLGDGMRPGATADASDRAQIEELITLGELASRAREAGVQVMIEGPGHVPLDQVVSNIQMQKSLCNRAPFYILGPLVTDIAAGYDHIAAAIGGAVAGAAGADFLCYVTPAEHLSLPDLDDVKQGIIASRIAAHTADMVKNPARFRKIDDEMSRARKALDWEKMFSLCLDPELAKQRRSISGVKDIYCSMCGEFCSVKTLQELGLL